MSGLLVLGLLGSMSEQLLLLVPCSSQAAPGTLSGDDASPVPGLAGTFKASNSPSLICGLKGPTHDAPLAGWGKGFFSSGYGWAAVFCAVVQIGQQDRVSV